MRKIEDLQRDMEEIKETLERHTHSGNDGSDYIYNDAPVTKTEQQFRSGDFTVTGININNVQRGALIVGRDEQGTDGSDNMEIVFENQPLTNGITNQSFIYGARSPLYVGTDCSVISGTSILSTKQYEFAVNSLAGVYLDVTDPVTGIVYGYVISSNTKDTITISGMFSANIINGEYRIFVPIYFGSAEQPWRRLYTLDGSGGGVRFGLGSTNQGQNGLLYSSGENLIWRSPSGSTTTIA